MLLGVSWLYVIFMVIGEWRGEKVIIYYFWLVD